MLQEKMKKGRIMTVQICQKMRGMGDVAAKRKKIRPFRILAVLMGAGTLAIIITERGKETAERISERAGRGVTSLRAVGAYTRTDREVLLCACSKAEAYLVKSAVQEADDKAFFMFTETSEVFGEGFKRIGQ